MTEQFFDYDSIVSDALRGAMRTILGKVASSGLPQGHHFYITFKTQDQGVCLSNDMKAQHPEEMTIVLQHQFWGLKVEEDRFEVGLSFNQRPETIIIPYQSVVAFVDPAAEFALQFDQDQMDKDQGKKSQAGGKISEATATIPAMATIKNESAGETDPSQPEQDPLEAAATEPDDQEAENTPENKVVALDAFRKKR